jgi:hypothetical protein
LKRVNNIDFIKIDVEGYESIVFEKYAKKQFNAANH